MTEIWKPVVGLETRYEVSNLGRVKSLRYRGHPKPAILPGTDLNGYRRYQLATGGKSRLVFGHILVLEAFVGPCPPGMEGCHDNGVRDDNWLDNLRWDTQIGNQADRLRHGTDSRGEKSGKAKLTEDQAKDIIRRRHAGEEVLDLAREFGVTGRTIYQIASGQRWSWLHLP